MAIPSLYRFFADRAEILDALLEHMTADLDPHARAAVAARRPRRPHRLELDTAAAYFEAHPSAVALWFGGRVSPLVIQTIRSPGPPDRQTIELGGIALTAFAERWIRA